MFRMESGDLPPLKRKEKVLLFWEGKLSGLYWLFNRDPYFMVYNNPHIIGYNPLYTQQTTRGHFFHGPHVLRMLSREFIIRHKSHSL